MRKFKNSVPLKLAVEQSNNQYIFTLVISLSKICDHDWFYMCRDMYK